MKVTLYRCWRRIALSLVVAFAAAVTTGCGGSDEKVVMPENPTPLPPPDARLTHADEDE